MIGQRFNRWLVLSFHSKTKSGNSKYLCRCDCGRESPVQDSHIKRGTSAQCKVCASVITGRKGLDAMAKQHLYFIGNDKHIKIGSTDDVSRRFKDIQNCCPTPLSILYQEEDAGYLEPIYHEIFKEHRMHGEWFDL